MASTAAHSETGEESAAQERPMEEHATDVVPSAPVTAVAAAADVVAAAAVAVVVIPIPSAFVALLPEEVSLPSFCLEVA